MTNKIYRTHDKDIYIQENRYEETKEVFKVIVDQIRDSGVLRDGIVVRDFGCAAG